MSNKYITKEEFDKFRCNLAIGLTIMSIIVISFVLVCVSL